MTDWKQDAINSPMAEIIRGEKMNAKQLEIQEAKESLIRRYNLTPGETVYTKLNHVSASGMMRVIDLYVMRDNAPIRITWSAAKATNSTYNRKHEGLQMGGCGMDMGFAAVYDLSYALFGEGYHCLGHGCPAPVHMNEHHTEAALEEHWRAHTMHKDGYALNHRWL